MVRGPVSLVIGGGICLLMLAFALGGPRLFERVMPESAMAWFDNLGLSDISSLGTFESGTENANGEDPASHLRDTSDGWKASDKVATLPGGGLAFVGQVIDGYSKRVEGRVPAPVQPLTEETDCSFTPPTADAFVGHASAAERRRLGVATYNDSHIAASVQQLVDIYRLQGTVETSELDGLAYQVFDIAVTETAKPVYLVLETEYGRPVYNIHLSPGARIERVVLIGGDETGVLNLDPAVPVEVMRTATAYACGIDPFYRLNPGALYFQSVANGAIKPEEVAEYEAKFDAMEGAWEGFFLSAFGVGAKATLSGDVSEVTLATVGPVPSKPEARAVWKTPEGAPFRATTDQYVDPVVAEEGRSYDAVVKAVAKSFAWGDLKNLSEGVEF